MLEVKEHNAGYGKVPALPVPMFHAAYIENQNVWDVTAPYLMVDAVCMENQNPWEN